MTTWRPAISAITLFVEDLPAAKEFYTRVFELPAYFEDQHSVVFRFGDVLVNLLVVTEAPELVEPGPVASPAAGARSVITIAVEDVDAVAARLTERGVTLLNGPQDRPWGVRTAAFADPAGHVWEVAH